MSKQLSVSATASVLAMVLFVLANAIGVINSAPASNGPMATPLTAVSN